MDKGKRGKGMPRPHMGHIKTENGLPSLVVAYTGCPGEEAVKWVFILAMMEMDTNNAQ